MELNDSHRKAIPETKTIITRGIDRLWPTIISDIIEKVRSFNDFNSNNDPYWEHDYGSFEHDGEKIYWKIDYYDKEFGIIDKSGVFFTQIYYLSKEDSMLSWVFFFLKVIYEVLPSVSDERIHTQYDYLY